MVDIAESGQEVKKTFIVPAIKPFDHYDFNRAKVASNLAWLVAKAFGAENIPEELQEPYYTDQYDQEHMKPPVMNLLLSADLYCRAGSLILKSDTAKPLLGHDAVIQALAQRGLYVTDHEKLVTERDLRKKPIQMSAHLAMIDTLMMAYTVEMVSIEKVIACVHKYSPFFQTADLPYDIEDAVMYWINKVNGHLKGILEQEQRVKEQQNMDLSVTQKARYRKEQNLYKQLPCIPLMENILKDGTDGCAIAALIHFYCPEVIRLEDICFKESMSLADSLYNLQLIQEFCQEYLNGCCHFSLEDMLYASSSIKANYLVFMAELFWWFEVVKPSFVQPRVVDTRGPMKTSSNSSRFNRRHTLSSSSNARNPQDASSSPGPAVIRRSSSMSYVDGQVGTWPKEKRSSMHGVSFDISFDKEDEIRVTTPSRPIRRSISNEGFSLNLTRVPKHILKNLSFQSINGQGQSDSINEEWSQVPQNYDDLSPTSNQWNTDEVDRNRQPNGPRENRIPADEQDTQIEAPSIEEALEIIHNPEKNTPTITDQVNNGFFLHNTDVNRGLLLSPLPLSGTNLDIIDTKGSQSPITDNTEVDTGIHIQSEDIPETMDEDSSLKDYTVSLDSDLDDHLKLQQEYGIHINNAREAVSPCPSSVSGRSQAGSTASSSSGVKMTSFAEQKFRKRNHGDSRSSGSSSQKTTPEGSELNIPQVVALGQIQEVNVLPQSKDATQLLASEVVQLRMKLEEKRRAIEAQKKKVEAAFTRQRQKMGRTAFLTVVKKKGDGISPLQEEAASMETEKGHQEISEEKEMQPSDTGIPYLKLNSEQISSRWLKSPTTPVDTEKCFSLTSPSEENLTDIDVGEYTKSIEKLNYSLNFLQQEMQRLALQQDMLMQMREKQAWVISPPQPSPQKVPQKESKPTTKPSVTWSPIPCLTLESPRQTHRSPQTTLKKTVSFPVKPQKTPRPNELKITPLNRTLTPPQSVDSLPRLRRFSPSQTQTRSFVYFGDDRKPVTEDQEAKEVSNTYECSNIQTSGNEDIDREGVSYQTFHPTGKIMEVEKKPIESTVSEVLSQPIIETVCLTPNDEVFSQRSFSTTKNGSLIEVPLSKLQPPEMTSEKSETEIEKEQFSEDQKVCCGFFFKDDRKEENDMAAKRAALLEKRLRRERENQQKKMEQEMELELKKEEARRKSEEERNKKEDEKLRREYIKQEYLRRKQLKLMEDMDSVIKPRVNPNRTKKARPKSLHRDQHVELPRTPIGAPPASSFSLASLNTGDNESVNSGKRTPSPFRSESVEGFLSPVRSGSRNGEKDWENASTTSSVASATEYTGPKLYKEPSAKSNKYIIQNAISHCCLAGKVNEGQKNKILEEMEKSNANNFLILFRDSGCQFRSVYMYYPETEEITKLAGIGPRSITRKMIDGLYKYNSDRKQFSHIPAKTMSASVDAVTIHSHLWQAKRPMTPKKLLSSKA
ncbi:LOW QUALITY PROTEIN: calmodulin-regulated spectrin-associated protein 2 [Bufo gargarizans]|uniref:LOW QUALITY PROTEIN: calmodulin-regulated spectrin-associated protein 2 n=1 Tax=Bufo gargarizans TaxID=30331 RepID=UPI001CF1ADA6|nr:LOW QUALITY PROTEIN: calmodulin-regulated spectrin-associated protein 2 [Bufo gargarizans]